MYKNFNASALGVTGHQSEILELALTYGFRGFDLDIVDFATPVKRRGLDYAGRMIRSANIRVSSFRLPVEWDTDDEVFKSQLATLSEYAKMAAAVGCNRCLATIAPAGDTRPYHENFEFHRRRFAEVCAVLEPEGVVLGLGFRAASDLRKSQAFQFIHDLDAVVLLVNMTGASNIGLVLDLWELTVCGGSIDSVRSLPVEQIVAVQVAQLPEGASPSDATEAERLLPGEAGPIDLPAYLRLLEEKGYRGPVTPAPHRDSLSNARREEAAKLAGEAMNRLWQAAGLAPEHRVHAPANP